jgi:hypothetical protein
MRAAGIKRQPTPMIIELDDGTKINGSWKDVTATKVTANGKTYAVTGRVDLYSPDKPSVYEGRTVSSLTVAGSPATVVRIRE